MVNVCVAEWRLLSKIYGEWQRKGNYPSGLEEYIIEEVWSWVPQETGNGSPYVTLLRVTVEYITTLCRLELPYFQHRNGYFEISNQIYQPGDGWV